MFKKFRGGHLIDEYQKAKQIRKDKKAFQRMIKFIIALTISLVVWLMPTASFGIDGLTVVEQRVIATFCFATLMWVLEPIPSWTTSVLIVVILLFTCSDSALSWLVDMDETQLGALISYKSIMSCFAHPVIMLFIGGFVLAIAATKSGLDVKLAKVLLKPFGTKSENVLLGFLLVTGIFSMFLSNTATAAMMLAFLTPVLKSLPANGKGNVALTMAIPVGANVGGIGTPIGTPPKVTALQDLLENHNESLPAIVACAFRAEAKYLYAELSKNYKCALIMGGISKEERARIEDEFKQGQIEVLVAVASTIAKGFNFQISHTMYMYSSSYNTEDRMQLEDRIHRYGQKEVCTYVDLLTEDSIDQRILDVLKGDVEFQNYMRSTDPNDFLKTIE